MKSRPGRREENPGAIEIALLETLLSKLDAGCNGFLVDEPSHGATPGELLDPGSRGVSERLGTLGKIIKGTLAGGRGVVGRRNRCQYAKDVLVACGMKTLEDIVVVGGPSNR